MSAALLESIQDLEEAEDKKIEYNSSALVMTIRKQVNSLESEIIKTNQDLYENVEA